MILGAGREGPCSCGSADKRDELPSLHGLLLFADTSYHARQSKRRSAIELDQCPSRKDATRITGLQLAH